VHVRPEQLMDDRGAVFLNSTFDVSDPRTAFRFRGMMEGVSQLETFGESFTDILHAPQFNKDMGILDERMRAR